MKAYFKHQLKNNARAIIIITVLMSVFTFLYALYVTSDRSATYYVGEEKIPISQKYEYGIRYEDDEPRYYLTKDKELMPIEEALHKIEYAPLGLTAVVELTLVFLCLGVPVWMFASLKKKSSLDLCHSLSITKRGLGVVHYLIGFIAVFLPFLMSYTVTIAVSVVFGTFEAVSLNYLSQHFLLCVLGIFAVYSIAVFAFERANSVVDGVVLIAVYMIVLWLICDGFYGIYQGSVRLYFGNKITEETPEAVLQYMKYYYTGFESDYGRPLHFFDMILLDAYERSAETGNGTYIIECMRDIQNVVWLVVWSLLGAFASFGAIYGFGNKNAESAGESSDSIFAYKLFIPLVGIPYVIANGVFASETISCLMVTVACVAVYTIYRRGVKYKKSDYIVIGIMLAITLGSLFFEDMLFIGTAFEVGKNAVGFLGRG